MTTQNASSNKLDYYLRRTLDYEVLLDPSEDGLTAAATGTLGVTLENTVDPKAELPQSVIGPNVPELQKGDNLSIVSVYSSLQFQAGAVNGLPIDMSTEQENGRNVVSDFYTIPGRSSLDFQFDVAGTVPLGADHWYRLDIGRQPTVVPDTVRVRVKVPAGWRIAETRGLRATESTAASAQFELTEPTDVRVRLERSGDRNLWDRLKEGP